MKHLAHWTLALLAVAAVADFSGAWTTPQDPPRQEKQEKEKKVSRQTIRNREREERQAMIRKALPTLKTSISEAIALAEKESAGKAYAGALEMEEGKILFRINLLVGEQFTVVTVDPETKKVAVLKKEAQDETGSGEEGKQGD